jgi:hypothetical protein
LKELFEADVGAIAGTEGKHRKDRTDAGHRGNTQLPIGGGGSA